MRSYVMKNAVSMVLAAIVIAGCSGASNTDNGSTSDTGNSSPPTDSASLDSETSLFPSDDTGSGPTDTATEDTAPSCVPSEGADDPDDDFKDSNCDGIDGDKARAIFVAPDGKDDAAGTIDAPVKSIGRAIEKANDSGKDVYACNGAYAENVVIAKAVRVYGGYDCKAGWKRTLDRAKIAPTKGIPLTVSGVSTGAVKLDRISLRAPDGVDAGESSIGLFANQSQVVVTNGEIESGSGADGRSPAAATAVTTPATKGADAVNGTPRNCPVNLSGATWTLVFICTSAQIGAQTTTTVPACEGRGGQGGNGGVWSRDSSKIVAPTAGAAGSPSPSPGAPGRSGSGAGLEGSAGELGASGAPSKLGIGTVTDKGYVADNAGSGGFPGKTGGGGSGGWGSNGGPTSTGDFPEYYYNGGAGGEGGFGGCGGAAGDGGGGGGGSFGVLSFKSTVTLTKTTITTSYGGRGGAGGIGADGQPGGPAGLGGRSTDPREPPSGRGFDGGAGGAGGRGGNGGAGGGGPSIGVLYVDTKPTTELVTFNIGSGGKGAASSGEKAADGVVGEIYPPVK